MMKATAFNGSRSERVSGALPLGLGLDGAPRWAAHGGTAWTPLDKAGATLGRQAVTPWERKAAHSDADFRLTAAQQATQYVQVALRPTSFGVGSVMQGMSHPVPARHPPGMDRREASTPPPLAGH